MSRCPCRTTRRVISGRAPGRTPVRPARGRAVEEWGVNIMRFENDRVVSEFMGATESLTPTDIMSRLVVTSATVTGLVDTLEKGGLVARQRHPTDRRSTLLTITPGGRALLDKLVPIL